MKVQFIKRAQHERSTKLKLCNMKKVQHEKVQRENSATWKDYYTKKCNMEMVQCEKSATWKNINCYNEIRKKCTRIVPHSAQTDNEPSVDGPLYTGKSNRERTKYSRMLRYVSPTNFLIQITCKG